MLDWPTQDSVGSAGGTILVNAGAGDATVGDASSSNNSSEMIGLARYMGMELLLLLMGEWSIVGIYANKLAGIGSPDHVISSQYILGLPGTFPGLHEGIVYYMSFLSDNVWGLTYSQGFHLSIQAHLYRLSLSIH